MKFLHTADLHLDSAFCADNPSDAESRRDQQRRILTKIFNVAKDENCDMILISGDLFDSTFVSEKTKELCVKLFSEFSRPVVIAPGNHDPFANGCFYKSASVPENVFVFSSTELQYFDFPELDTTVAGYAFTSSALLSNPLAQSPAERQNGRVLLLCAHTELDTPTTRYAPIQCSDILRYGFDYAALGHVHNIPNTPANIRYCGFAEGRSFDEQGDGGVLIVTADGTEPPHVEKIIVSDMRFLNIEVSVDGLSDSAEIEAAIRATVREVTKGKPTALRLELTGITGNTEPIDPSQIRIDANENLLSLKITDNTFCLPDRASLEKDTSLRGEFYRELRDKLTSEDKTERALALRALKIGLAAIDGKAFTDGGRT